jgi:4-amino-4-deoxy-L-arabinose transferase-like glycosyltransferase
MTPTSPFRSAAPAWRELVDLPLLTAIALLLPVVFLLSPLPIDETRYLAVAWEMRQSGEFLVPHLNGATYAHKPPLLFWLINAGWALTGVHAWTARAMTLLCSLASLALLHRLAWRLSASAAAARSAVWVLLGAIYFAAFANAIMFDVLLATCVLLAAHGILDLVEARTTRGIAIAGGAIGLGILVKGPVMLLDIAFVALLAPWWSAEQLAGRRARYFGGVGLAVLLGAAIGLAWAIPAALHGGDAYANAIFLRQTFDRIEGVKGASTHGRPFWWYAMIFPFMLLPWPLVLRGRWNALREIARARDVRFALAWLVPTFIAFSLIGGKQPHYLLPAIPAFALLVGAALDRGGWRVSSGLFGATLVPIGLFFAWLPHHAVAHGGPVVLEHGSPLWGIATALLGAALLVFARRLHGVAWPVLATLACVLMVKLAIVQGTGTRYDIRLAAERIRVAQEQGRPIVHMGWHHGVYEFAARQTEPLQTLGDIGELERWAAIHPDGLVVSFYERFRFRATPVFTTQFRGAEVSIWNVREALASGVDKEVAHSRDADDEDSDD